MRPWPFPTMEVNTTPEIISNLFLTQGATGSSLTQLELSD